MTEKPFDPNDASLEEMRKLFSEFPGPDLDAGTQAMEREVRLTKPRGALGRLEELAGWLATWQGRHPPRVEHPRTAVFAANHGVAARGVSAFPSSVTEQMVANFVNGGAAVNQLCKTFDADLRVYEMALEQATKDFTVEPAMDEGECARAMAYGMMSVEPGLDVLCLGEMGIGNTTSAAALACALFGGEAKDWVGTGTGVSGTVLETKTRVIDEGVAKHRHAGDPLQLLAALGGA